MPRQTAASTAQPRTAIALGLEYLGCIVVSRTLIAPLLGGSELAIVASTRAIAALFNPLRRRNRNTSGCG